MFSKDCLDKFYEYENKDDFEVEDEVKSAYFVLIFHFCSCVSSHWKDYLSIIRNKENATFINELAPSDEVYAFWFIQINYEEEKANAEYIKAEGDVELKKLNKKKGKRGKKHQSNEFFPEFKQLARELEEFRRNKDSYKFWMDIFFDEYFSDQQPKQPIKARKRRYADTEELPIPLGYGLSTDLPPGLGDPSKVAGV